MSDKAPIHKQRTMFKAYHEHSRDLAICLALILLVAINFSNALKGEFAFDDKDMIQNNVLIRDLRNLGQIFTTSWWWGGARQKSDEYRPLTITTFALNYQLNRLNPFGYHVVNVALHAAVVVLLFLFFKILTRRPALSGVAAAFFAAHPIHTEAINNVVGRAELLAAMFFFLGLVSYTAFRQAPRRRSLALYAASLIAYFLGLLSKENAITLLPVIILYDLTIYRRDITQTAESNLLRYFRPLLPFYAGYIVILVIYFALRLNAIGRLFSSGMTISSLDNNLVLAKTSGGWTSYYLTTIKVIAYYVYLLLLPLHLSVDYSYNQIPLSHGLAEPRTALALLIVIASALAIIYYYRRSNFIPFFSIAFFFLTFAPVSNFFKLIATILGERLMYLPSAGFCLLLAYVLTRVVARLARSTSLESAGKRAFLVAAGIIIVLYSTRTIVRNNDWRSELRLFESAVRVTPNSARAHYNLGNDYKARGLFEKAERHFRRAYEIAPFYGAPLSSIAEIMRIKGRPNEAVKLLKQVIEMEDRYFPAHYNLGRTYFDLGEYEKALKEYERTIELRPTAPQPYYAMCEVYFTLQRWNNAEQILKKVLKVTPDPAFAWAKLGLVYAKLNRPDEALEALQRAVQLNPNDAEIHLYLGEFYASQKQNDAALESFTRALELAPNNAEIHLTLARFHHFAFGNGERALYHFRRALQIQPNHPLRQKILETMNDITSQGKKD